VKNELLKSTDELERVPGYRKEAIDQCGCGQCRNWLRAVDHSNASRLDAIEYVELLRALGLYIWNGAQELYVDQWMGEVSDKTEQKIRERTDRAGQWFDPREDSAIAIRQAQRFAPDVYEPGSLLKCFDSEPCPSQCDALQRELNPTSSLSERLKKISARVNSTPQPGDTDTAQTSQGHAQTTQPNHDPGTNHAGHNTPDGPPTATHDPKDCVAGQNQAQNRGSERSDRETGPVAFGRDQGPYELVEKSGIRFHKRWPITESQASMIDAATEGLSSASHHFFVHGVRSTISELRKGDGWFPFWYEHIRIVLPCTEQERRRTELVWRPLVNAGLLTYKKHSCEDSVAREFKVNEDWIQHFLEARFQDQGETMIDAFTGTIRNEPKRETSLHDHNDHKYTGSLLEGLKALKESVRRFNKPAVEDLLVERKRRAEEARAGIEQEFTGGYERYKQAFFEVRPHNRAEDYSNTDSFEQWKLLYEGQKWTTEFLRWRKLRQSYLNDLQCYATILRQRPRRVEGDIWEYDTAWEAQGISGRVSEIGGGMQSASKEMKAAAYTGVQTHNYDIVGSQLSDVITATEMVPDIDTEELEEIYLETTKTDNAKAIGIERSAYKSLLYATTFLASWAPDVSTALAQANPVTGVPQTLKIIRTAGWQEGIDVDQVYERAQSHFLPLKKAVRKLADYLLTDYWEDHKQNAGGWYMENACGVTFRKSDYEDSSTHETRSKVLAWFLQGAEADKMHRLAARCQEQGTEVLGNEHDGLITASPIPDNLQNEVLKSSDLERKPFEEDRIEVESATTNELDDVQEDMNDIIRKRQADPQ
jgi:hypothetical protein